MRILDDGGIYLEKGEPFPWKCPECGKYIEYHKGVAEIVCGGCGLQGTPEDFSEVCYGMKLTQ